jgi:hypothetical protein
MATLLKLDGFEHGNVASGTAGVYDTVAGAAAIVTTPVRTGLRALEMTPAAGAENVQYTIPAGNRIVAMSFYIRAAVWANLSAYAFFVNANGNCRFRYQSSTNQFQLLADTGLLSVAVGPALSVDTWYQVDLEFDSTTNPAVFRARIDGGIEASVSPSQAAADTTSVGLGTQQSNTYTGYYDDWIISVTDGDYPLGGYHVEPLSPSADGTHNITASGDFDGTTTQFSNATTDSYLNIDDVPLNSSNTDGEVIRQDLGTTDEYMEHLYTNLPAGTDVPVDVRVYAVDVDGDVAGTNLAVLKFLLEDNTPLTDVRLSSDDPGTTVTWRKKMLDRPIGGWVGAHVDGLKSRWGFSDADPDAILLGVLVEVAMTAPPPPPPESFPTRRSLVA